MRERTVQDLIWSSLGGASNPGNPRATLGKGKDTFGACHITDSRHLPSGSRSLRGREKPKDSAPVALGLAKKGKKVGTGHSESIADFAKPFLDAIVVEDCQRDRRLSDPASTGESDGVEVFCKTNDALDELFAPKTGSWRWGR